MGRVKVAVAVALEDHPARSKKLLDVAAATVLCNRIPDLFDYVCDEEWMHSYTVMQIRKDQGVLKKVYGYFDRYGYFSGELSAMTSKNGGDKFENLWCGLKDNDLIYIIEAHI